MSSRQDGFIRRLREWVKSPNASIQIYCTDLDWFESMNAYSAETNSISIAASLPDYKYLDIIRHEMGIHAANHIKFNNRTNLYFGGDAQTEQHLKQIIGEIFENAQKMMNALEKEKNMRSRKEQKLIQGAIKIIDNTKFIFEIWNQQPTGYLKGNIIGSSEWLAEVLDEEVQYEEHELELLATDDTNQKYDVVIDKNLLPHFLAQYPEKTLKGHKIKIEGKEFLVEDYKHIKKKPSYVVWLNPLMLGEMRLQSFLYKFLGIHSIKNDSLYTDYPLAEISARLGEFRKPVLDFFAPQFVSFIENQWKLRQSSTKDEL